METPTGWTAIEGKFVKEYKFESFMEAHSFIENVAILAEKLGHHPEIWNSYDKVKLTLSTHDAGDIATEKDVELADEINAL